MRVSALVIPCAAAEKTQHFGGSSGIEKKTDVQRVDIEDGNTAFAKSDSFASHVSSDCNRRANGTDVNAEGFVASSNGGNSAVAGGTRSATVTL